MYHFHVQWTYAICWKGKLSHWEQKSPMLLRVQFCLICQKNQQLKQTLLVDIVILYNGVIGKRIDVSTFSAILQIKAVHFSYDPQPWVSNGSKPWDLPPPHQQFWKCTISTGILLFFIFLLKWHEWLSLFLHSKRVKKDCGLLGISLFLLKLANVTSTYWATSGALPGYALPTHCPSVPSKIQQPPGDSGYRVGRGPAQFTGAADIEAEQWRILQV